MDPPPFGRALRAPRRADDFTQRLAIRDRASWDGSYLGRTKHIDIRYHFIREYVESKRVNIVYISTNNMIADILTKLLGPTKFEHFRIGLGLTNGNI